MSETKTETKVRARRIPRIVFDRPGFDRKRFGIFLLVSIVVAVLLAALLYWTAGLGADPDQGTDAAKLFPSVYELPSTAKYVPVTVILGILAGVGLGWAWKRGVMPRIEMYEVQTTTTRTTSGRRSGGRSLQRFTP